WAPGKGAWQPRTPVGLEGHDLIDVFDRDEPYAYDPDGPVDHHDGASLAGAWGVETLGNRSMADVTNYGSPAGAAPVRLAPSPPKRPPVPQAFQYTRALRVASVPRGPMGRSGACP